MSITVLYKKLQAIAPSFTEADTIEKMSLLSNLPKIKSSDHSILLEYHDILLYILAYPDNEQVHALASKAMKQISTYFKNSKVANLEIFENSGLPNTHMYSRFTHDFSRWIDADKDASISLYNFEEEHTPLYQLLKISLPALEQEVSSGAADNEELLQQLHLSPTQQFSFLLSEFSKYDSDGYLKDFLWEAAKPLSNVHFKAETYSRSWNRLTINPIYFHRDLQKKFDHQSLLATPLPAAKKLSKVFKDQLIQVIKRNLVLAMRETDPVTYMDSDSLQYFELDRGISVAIFGMKAERQLPIFSYIGYTLFKNGYPMSYGGSWIAASTANFGINIFEPYRGGESGLTLIQLLRVYSHAFGVDYFEIEPYQFGQDNPDGIKSGAFWFYYKFGFRPVDPTLRKLADSEYKKITAGKGYRSSEEILIRFTDSNLALQMHQVNRLAFIEVQDKVSKHIAKKYHGDRNKARQLSLKAFIDKTAMKTPKDLVQLEVLHNMALLADSLHIVDSGILATLQQIVKTKLSNVYAYNQLLIVLAKQLKQQAS